jgi:hypothetical protein
MVTWVVHVDQQTNPKDALYDMIIGMDCMCKLGIYVNTDEKVITWEGNSIPQKERGQLQDEKLLNYLCFSQIELHNALFCSNAHQRVRLVHSTYHLKKLSLATVTGLFKQV